MNTTLRITRIALALGLGLAPVLAQQPERPRVPHADRGDRDEAMNKRLKLTDAQKKTIEAIRAKHAEAMKAKLQTAKEAQKALHEAMGKNDTPADQLRSLHKAASDAQFEVLLAHRELRKEIHDQLTPEQREQAARMEGFRMGRKGARKGFGPAGFGPEGHPGFGPGRHHEGSESPEKAPVKPDAQ